MTSAWNDHVVPQISLFSGDVQCCEEPTSLVTVLGSCVSVCLWDWRRGIGAMNHFVLPTGRGLVRDTRYGDVAMEAIALELQRLGSRQQDLLAKMFGGAEVLHDMGGRSVGSGNVSFAADWLYRAQISVIAQRTGGTVGRWLRFDTGSGEVLTRGISS